MEEFLGKGPKYRIGCLEHVRIASGERPYTAGPPSLDHGLYLDSQRRRFGDRVQGSARQSVRRSCASGIVLSRVPTPPFSVIGASLIASIIVIVAIGIALLGPGAYSVDSHLFGRREDRNSASPA